MSSELSAAQQPPVNLPTVTSQRRDYKPSSPHTHHHYCQQRSQKINITLCEKTRRDKQKHPSDLGLRRDNFKGKQKTRGTRPRHTQSVCVTVRLFLRAAWPLCLFASLGRWKTGFYALVAFHCGPTPCRQRMKIPCEGRLRQTLKDNRGVRGGCESFFPFSAKHLEKRRFIRDQCWRFSSPAPDPLFSFFSILLLPLVNARNAWKISKPYIRSLEKENNFCVLNG